MDAQALKQYFVDTLADNEASIDWDGDSRSNVKDLINFEIHDGEVPLLSVVLDLMDDDDPRVMETRQFAYTNPAYHWLEAAYLICAMRECGWKMLPYTEHHDTDGWPHDLHNGSGIQIIFVKDE